MTLTEPYFEDHDGSYYAGYYCPRYTWYCDRRPTKVLTSPPPFCEDGEECVLQTCAIKIWRWSILCNSKPPTTLEWDE